MRRALVISALFLIAGCTQTAQSLPGNARPSCSEGIAPLYFREGSPALDPLFAKVLDWPARAAAGCRVVTITVRGLPNPSDETLAGKRAASVVAAFQGFGVPAPTFELGDADDQASPVFQMDARPW